MPLTSCLIEIQINDRVEYEDGRKGKVLMIKLVPRDNSNSSLIAMLKVKLDVGNHIVASSNRFRPVDEDGIYYKECYPSGMLFEKETVVIKDTAEIVINEHTYNNEEAK